MCFFPFVGLFIGLCFFGCGFGFFLLHEKIGFGLENSIERTLIFSSLTALFLTVFPIFVTGGIHLDGFMDTCDALGSHASVEKKLEILKDSHVGAFAVLGISVYLLSYFVFSFCLAFEFFESHKFFLPYCSIFFISRLLSAIAVCKFPLAKNSGLVHTFSDNSAKKFTFVWCVIFLLLSFFALIFFFGLRGILVPLVSVLVFVFYFLMSKKNFGGITGDLAGWFVQVCELFCLMSLVFAG